MTKKNILFINGIPDDKKVEVHTILKDGRIGWATSGSANIADYIQNDFFNRSMVTFDTNLVQDIELNDIHAVFNHISDADTHKIALSKVEDLHKHVSGKMPFFNAPENIRKTTRDNIYQLLQGIDKLHIPKTVKIQPTSPSDVYDTIEKEGFKFPVIFRQAGDHGGISTIRIDDNSQQFHAFALDGKEYYLTQFVEYADDDGMYAKYRLVVVNGEVFLRHVMFAKNWMVHDKNQLEEIKARKKTSSQFNNEIKPSIQPIITQIHHRLGLDYFGIDCHIDNEMNLLVFEINANMNVFTTMHNSVFKKHTEKILQALIKMLTNDTH